MKVLIPRNAFELKLVTHAVFPVQWLKLYLQGLYLKDFKFSTRLL